ncbi:hypothetical protein ASE66_25050 [Bosea sp. Root483D1]|nr:hypothetical protein ASE66_25050 [Bosea sp. Root483D1]
MRSVPRPATEPLPLPVAERVIAGLEYRYSQVEENTYTYPVGVGGLGMVGFKQQLSTNQVVGQLLYKF